MKKAGIYLILITLIFCAFSGGFFLGKSLNPTTISVSSIPTVTSSTAAEAPSEPSQEPAVNYPLDINTATTEDFSTLPGIGETIAQRIVAYRNENGPFEDYTDLLLVKGIGEKTLQSILQYISIGGQS